MKIVSLTAENVKRLKAVTIKPDGTMVVIGGRNEQGKSSVLDSIAYALGGQKLCPAEPIRQGEGSARVSVDLGEIVVERTFTAKGSYLKVLNKDGFEARSPQALLDKLIGNLSFDPLAFSRMAARDQADVLRKVAGVDLSDLDRDRAILYTERTNANRDAQRLAAKLPAVAPEMPAEGPVDVAALMEELAGAEAVADKAAALAREAERAGAAVESIRRDQERAAAEMASTVKVHKAAIEGAEAQIRALKERITIERAKIAELESDTQEAAERNKDAINTADTKAIAAADAAKDAEAATIPTQPIKDKIAAAEGINARVREAEAYKAAAAEADTAKAKADDLTIKIKALDDERAARIAAADLPIKGLSFDDSGVRLNGVPFEQISEAQKLQASVAMGLAVNPGVKVVLIRDGSLLDSDHLAMVADMAEKAGAQVWIERVGNGPEVSVLIEDGCVVPTICSECGAALVDGATSEDVTGLCPACLLKSMAEGN